MDLIRFSIDNPVKVTVCVLLTVLFGLIGLAQIPIQLTPNIETTTISITTRWEGASPKEIETEIILEQEEKLRGASNLKEMTSSSRFGEGEIVMDFHQGITPEEALLEVTNRLNEVRSYPENVDRPTIKASNPQDRDYIAWLIISSTDPNFDVRHLYDFLDDRVKPELEKIDGMGQVNVIGGVQREVKISVDPVRMAQLGVTAQALSDALRTGNADASAGDIPESKVDFRIRSVGRFDNLQAVRNILLSRPGEPVVQVKDVAEVDLTFKQPKRLVRNKGRTVLGMNAQRKVGANVVQVMAEFKKRLGPIRDQMLAGEARRLGINGIFTLEQVDDQTIYINQAVDLVLDSLWKGSALAVLVLLVFLRSFRSTLIIGLSIPISVVGTFLFMELMGRSINVVSLAGIAFATGMVVDNAIVVLENIDRHRRFGRSAAEAAYAATKEVWGAILASTLTTLVVFLPVIFMQEEAGQLFKDIALAVCGSVGLSLIVSITVIPAATKWLLKRSRKKTLVQESGETPPVPKSRTIEPAEIMVHGVMGRSLFWLNRGWLFRPAVVALIIIASIGATLKLIPQASYLPAGNRNLIFSMMFAPPGYTVEQQASIGLRLEDQIRPYWEMANKPEAERTPLPQVPSMDMKTGQMKMVDVPPIRNFFFVGMPETMFMGGISLDDANVPPVAALMNNAIQQIPDVRGFATQQPLFRTAKIGVGSGLDLDIFGPDLDQVTAAASLLSARFIQRYGGRSVNTSPNNFDLPGPEIRVVTTPEKDAIAADLGLTQRHINTAIQVLGDGAIIGDFIHLGKAIDLKIMAIDSNLKGDATYLSDVPLATPSGRVVPLSSVRDVVRTIAPQQINHVKQLPSVTVQITVPDEIPLEGVMEQVNLDLDELRETGAIPSSIQTNLSGSAAKLRQVKNSFLGEWTGWNVQSLVGLASSRLFLVLLVTYLLMAALFENWFYPFVIMFTVPLASAGGFAALRVVQFYVPTQQLDIVTMLGFVILTGVVVNNAILIVHQALNLMRGDAEAELEGRIVSRLPHRQAIALSVQTRLRPIMMTMLTSLGGMLPLVISPGSGSELYRGLGAVLLGGMLVSTVVTLVLIPLTLGLLLDLREMLFGHQSAAEPAGAKPADLAVGK